MENCNNTLKQKIFCEKRLFFSIYALWIISAAGKNINQRSLLALMSEITSPKICSITEHNPNRNSSRLKDYPHWYCKPRKISWKQFSKRMTHWSSSSQTLDDPLFWCLPVLPSLASHFKAAQVFFPLHLSHYLKKKYHICNLWNPHVQSAWPFWKHLFESCWQIVDAEHYISILFLGAI